MANEDGSVIAVQNGEIYNYKELRAELRSRGHRFESDNDTEVIPHAYEEFGEAVPARLRGMFAIAVWDEPRRKLVLVRDRIGKKPLVIAPSLQVVSSALPSLSLAPALVHDKGRSPTCTSDAMANLQV